MRKPPLPPLCSCAESASSSEVDQLSARIAEREGQLSGLNKELQQRRTTIPTWMGQRLEQHSSTVCDAPADEGEADEAPKTTALARTTEALMRCSSVSSNAFAAAADVTSVLSHASQVTQQLASLHAASTAGSVTAIDLVITAAAEKENASSSADVAASMLKRRLETHEQQAKQEKSARLQ